MKQRIRHINLPSLSLFSVNKPALKNLTLNYVCRRKKMKITVVVIVKFIRTRFYQSLNKRDYSHIAKVSPIDKGGLK